MLSRFCCIRPPSASPEPPVAPVVPAFVTVHVHVAGTSESNKIFV